MIRKTKKATPPSPCFSREEQQPTMIDKTVKFAKLKMKRPAGTPIPDFPLPDGFKYTFYQAGDEIHWARIETSVGEFDSEFAALMRFKEDFSVFSELPRRCVFIENPDGEKVATATAWWAEIEGKRRAWVHWVSVDPSYQGLGLGKAISSKVLKIMCELEGDVDVYLSTQTWSHVAIFIYEKCGYEPTDEPLLYGKVYKGHYKKALKILEKIRR